MKVRAEVLLVYLSALALGIVIVTFPAGANIFMSTSEHALSSSQYGALFIPMIGGAILASSGSGALVRSVSMKSIFVGGLVANIAAMLLLAASAPVVHRHSLAFALLLSAMAVYGCGFGLMQTAMNTLVPSFFPTRRAVALTALHATVGVGTALPPLLLRLCVCLGAWWILPLANAGLLLALTVASLTQRLVVDKHEDVAIEAGRVQVSAPPSRLAGFAVLIALYGVCEALLGNWGTVLLHDERGLANAAAGSALSLFWAMVTAGRVLVALIARWIPPRRVHLVLPLLLAFGFLAISGSHGEARSVLAFAVAGLGCSAFLPLTMGMATEGAGGGGGAAGVMMAAFMLGNGVSAFGVGPLREGGAVLLSSMYVAGAGVAVALSLLTFLLRPVDPAEAS